MTTNNPTYYDVSILVEELQALFQTPETALATATHKKIITLKNFPPEIYQFDEKRKEKTKIPISSPFFSFPRRENEKNSNYLMK